MDNKDKFKMKFPKQRAGNSAAEEDDGWLIICTNYIISYFLHIIERNWFR